MPAQKRSAVEMSEHCGLDVVTLVEMLSVPSQYVAAVIIETDVRPNSAVDWLNFHRLKQCQMLTFFDTRRPVQALYDVVARVLYLNHSIALLGMPLFQRRVDRDVARQRCQCGRDNCPAADFRNERMRKQLSTGSLHTSGDARAMWNMIRSKLALMGVAVGANAKLPNNCWLTSLDYDTDLVAQLVKSIGKSVAHLTAAAPTAAAPKTAVTSDDCSTSDTSDSKSAAPKSRFSPKLKFWMLYDKHTRMPLLPHLPPETKDASEWGFAAMGTAFWRAMQFNKSVYEQTQSVEKMPADAEADSSVTSSSDVTTEIVHSTLTMQPINVDDVMRRRAQSDHASSVCWYKSEDECRKLLESGFVLGEVFAVAVESAIDEPDKEKSDYDASGKPQTRLERSNAVLDLIKSHITPRQGATPNNKGASRAAHGYGCACLIETFLRVHCTKQIHVVAVPTPVNPAARDAGDSVFAVESTMMRNMIVFSTVEPTLANHTLNCDQTECNLIVVDNISNVRSVMRRVFGPFDLKLTRKGIDYRSSSYRQAQHMFCHYVDRLIERNDFSKIGRISGSLDSANDYDEILRRTKMVFADEHPDIGDAISLTEVALLRGLLAKPDIVEKRRDWLTPWMEHIITHHVESTVAIERYAREVLENPANNRRIMADACERMVVAEFAITRNWRLAMARCSTVLFLGIDSLVEFRKTLVYNICMIVLVHQLDEVTTLMRQRALERMDRRVLTVQQQEQGAQTKKPARERRRLREQNRKEKRKKVAAAAAQTPGSRRRIGSAPTSPDGDSGAYENVPSLTEDETSDADSESICGNDSSSSISSEALEVSSAIDCKSLVEFMSDAGKSLTNFDFFNLSLST